MPGQVFVQDNDPGAVGAGRFWLTTAGVLSMRNAANTGWIVLCTDCGVSIVQFVVGQDNLHMPLQPASGNTLIYCGTTRGANLAGVWDYVTDGYTSAVTPLLASTGDGVDIIYRHTGVGERITLATVSPPAINGVITGMWIELPGLWVPAQHGEGGAVSFNPHTAVINPASTAFVFAISAQGQGGAWDSAAGTLNYAEGPGWTKLLDSPSSVGHPSTFGAYKQGGGAIQGDATINGNPALNNADYGWAMQALAFVPM